MITSALKISLFIIAVSIVSVANAQTGPAGVGNTSSNALWLKANAGTSTTTAGAAIATWNDQSGNGNHVSQSNVNRRPLYQTGVMNGMPSIQFDNVSGTNDKFEGADSPTLDNTAGLTIFTVSRPTALDGEARSIIAKRVNVGVDQSYMFFYYTGNFIHTDVVSNNDRFSTTPTTFSNNNNYLLDLLYDGTLTAANRSKVYSAQSLIKTSTETSASIPDFNSPLIIGSTHDNDNRPFGGYISEVIVFREALNTARRIIVDNYLSSKYAITLSANDFYAGDTPGNGNFDSDVAGIGQFSASENHTTFSPSATLGLGLTYKSGFDAGDYIFAGQNLTTNANITTDVAVVSGGPISHRWQRIWYIDVTNTSTGMVADVVFDLSAGGFPGITAAVPSNYKLLYRSTNSGNWTIVASATVVAGDVVTFENFSFAGNGQDGYYTIATLNNTVSQLPIELLDFNAVLNDKQVDVYWITASEINNDYFTIEKSKNGTEWIQVATVDGAGSSAQVLSYQDLDPTPFSGVSYYRLKQTDFDGQFSYSDIVTINNVVDSNGNIIPFPNPVTENNFNLEFSGFGDEEVLVVVRDIQGKQFYSKVHAVRDHHHIAAIDLEDRLAPGTYLVVASSVDSYVSCKLIVK